MVAAAVGTAAVAGAAASTYSASKQASAAKSAANTQSKAADAATQFQYDALNQLTEQQQPYMDLGSSSISKLQSQLNSSGINTPFSFDASNLSNTPGYQFTLNQGNRAVNNQSSASGLNLSGAQLKGISDYTTGLADNTYNQQYTNALNTYNTNYDVSSDQYNRLASLVGLGQSAAAGVGNAGVTTANQAGNYLTSGANASASGTVAAANAQAAGVNNAANTVSNAGLLYSLMK